MTKTNLERSKFYAVMQQRTVFAVLAAGLILSACGPTPTIVATGGIGAQTGGKTPAGGPTPEEQQAAQQAALIAQNQQTRELAQQGLNRAFQSLLRDCAPGSLRDSSGPARNMMRDLHNLRQEILSADAADPNLIPDKSNQAQALLANAYLVAVNCGAVNPSVVGQRSWQETWWYISS